jgi:transcriptional regulator with XRE-family HTH domain
MKTGREIIAVAIKKKRLEKKISQVELAGLLGIDKQYVWRLENGEINFSIDYLDKIIECLDCEHTDFLVISL